MLVSLFTRLVSLLRNTSHSSPFFVSTSGGAQPRHVNNGEWPPVYPKKLLALDHLWRPPTIDYWHLHPGRKYFPPPPHNIPNTRRDQPLRPARPSQLVLHTYLLGIRTQDGKHSDLHKFVFRKHILYLVSTLSGNISMFWSILA